MCGVPDRLEEGVGEAEVEKVLHRLLAEEVIDPVDRRLGKRPMQRGVERLGRREVAAERLLHDEPGRVAVPDARQLRRHRPEQARRDREIEQRTGRRAKRLAQRVERPRLQVVAGHVGQSRRELAKTLGLGAAVSGDALPGPGPQLLDAPGRLGDPDDRDGQVAVAAHVQQRRKNLLVGEVARGPEQDQRVRVRLVHGRVHSR